MSSTLQCREHDSSMYRAPGYSVSDRERRVVPVGTRRGTSTPSQPNRAVRYPAGTSGHSFREGAPVSGLPELLTLRGSRHLPPPGASGVSGPMSRRPPGNGGCAALLQTSDREAIAAEAPEPGPRLRAWARNPGASCRSRRKAQDGSRCPSLPPVPTAVANWAADELLADVPYRRLVSPSPSGCACWLRPSRSRDPRVRDRWQ